MEQILLTRAQLFTQRRQCVCRRGKAAEHFCERAGNTMALKGAGVTKGGACVRSRQQVLGQSLLRISGPPDFSPLLRSADFTSGQTFAGLWALPSLSPPLQLRFFPDRLRTPKTWTPGLYGSTTTHPRPGGSQGDEEVAGVGGGVRGDSAGQTGTNCLEEGGAADLTGLIWGGQINSEPYFGKH